VESIIGEAVKRGEVSSKARGGRIAPRSKVDDELEDILSQLRSKIVVVGSGGAGCNTITRLMEVRIEGANTITMNTDAQDLLCSYANDKILIGRMITKGLGAGSMPQIGEEAAKESEAEIKKAVQGADIVFLTCGLGGGTGTGSLPVVADIAKKAGALTVAIVTFPFTMEGIRRRENAEMGLEKLRKETDTVIVIPNDRLLEIAPRLPLGAAFKVADEILVRAVKGITELITKPGLINLDFADVRTVMEGGGVAMIGMGESNSENRAVMIGMGESNSENRAVEAIEKAINSPLLSVDITGAKGALINVIGGEDLTLEESERVVEVVSQRLDPKANIIWGSIIDPDLEGVLRVLLVVTGVRSKQIIGQKLQVTPEERSLKTELGIDFID
jgi:cell division protein FtsZ